MTQYLLLACFAGSLAAQPTLDVHVYDWANVPASTLEQTAQELLRIFRVSGIQIRWIVEPPDSPDARKVVLVSPPARGRERDAACVARRDAALSILTESAVKTRSGVLGNAEPFAPSGINVTVFYAPVVDAANNYGISIGVVLGHADRTRDRPRAATHHIASQSRPHVGGMGMPFSSGSSAPRACPSTKQTLA